MYNDACRAVMPEILRICTNCGLNCLLSLNADLISVSELRSVFVIKFHAFNLISLMMNRFCSRRFGDVRIVYGVPHMFHSWLVSLDNVYFKCCLNSFWCIWNSTRVVAKQSNFLKRNFVKGKGFVILLKPRIQWRVLFNTNICIFVH